MYHFWQHKIKQMLNKFIEYEPKSKVAYQLLQVDMAF